MVKTIIFDEFSLPNPQKYRNRSLCTYGGSGWQFFPSLSLKNSSFIVHHSLLFSA